MQRHSDTKWACAVLLALTFTGCDVEADDAEHQAPEPGIITGTDDSTSTGDAEDNETSNETDEVDADEGESPGAASWSDLPSQLGSPMVEVGDVVPFSLIPDRAVYVFRAGEEVATIHQLGITMDDVLSQEFQDSLPVIAEQYRVLWGLPPWPLAEIICAYTFSV